ASLMDGQQINGFVRMRETVNDQEAGSGGQNKGNLGNQESGLMIEFKEVGKVDLPPKPADIS
ncbi:uncharacterized protein METZ01_LOCUS242890, partial [marine metagenome]